MSKKKRTFSVLGKSRVVEINISRILADQRIFFLFKIFLNFSLFYISHKML